MGRTDMWNLLLYNRLRVTVEKEKDLLLMYNYDHERIYAPTSVNGSAFIALFSYLMTHRWVTAQKKRQEVCKSATRSSTVCQGEAAGWWRNLVIMRKHVTLIPRIQIMRTMIQQPLMEHVRRKTWKQWVLGRGKYWYTVNERLHLTDWWEGKDVGMHTFPGTVTGMNYTCTSERQR